MTGRYLLWLVYALGTVGIGAFGYVAVEAWNDAAVAPVYRFADPDLLPAVYTGEAVDIDGDDQPEAFLFGDPGSPEVERFGPDRNWLATITAALFVGSGAWYAAEVQRRKT